MRTIRVLLAALVTAVVCLVLAPRPAFACSCVPADTAEYVDRADVVVTGTVEDRDSPRLPFTSSMDPATYTVIVDRVHKGAVPRTLQVLSPDSGASCGLENIELGERYVVFAASQDIEGEGSHDLWSSLCGGTGPASAALVADVVNLAGPGRAPSRDDVRSAAPSGAVVGGAVFAGVLAVGSVSVLALQRRRSRQPSR